MTVPLLTTVPSVPTAGLWLGFAVTTRRRHHDAPPPPTDTTLVGGWTGEITKVDKRGKGITSIKWPDGTMHFPFQYVIETFRPIG